MAHHLKGDLCEEVNHASLFSRSPPAGSSIRPSAVRAPCVRSLVASWSVSPSSLGCCTCTAAPARYSPNLTAAATQPYSGRRTWSGSGSSSDSSPMPRWRNAPAARRLVQPHDHLPRLASFGLPRKKKIPRASSRTARRSKSRRQEFSPSWPAWTRAGWSSWTSAGPTRR